MDQGLKVREVGVWEDAEWQWRLSWRRDRFVWERTQEEEFFRSLINVKLNGEEQDKKVGGDDLGCFSVKTTYVCFFNHVTSINYDMEGFSRKITNKSEFH